MDGVHRAVVPPDEGHAIARGERGSGVFWAVREQRALEVPRLPLHEPPALAHVSTRPPSQRKVTVRVCAPASSCS